MIARLLRALWAAAIVVAAALAAVSIHLFGDVIGPWAAGFCGIALLAASHPAAIAFNFAVSRFAGDPVPPAHRLTAWRALTMWDAEIDASMRGLWFATPFLCSRPAARPAPDTPLRALPILFVHGYFCNRAVWLSFMRDAASRGYLCEAVTLHDPFAPIESHGVAIGAAIDGLLDVARAAGTPAERVLVVAHSMGGLVVRSYAATTGDRRIAHAVTLGTPHRGTFTARFGSFASVVQMRRDSPWIAALAAAEEAGGGLPRAACTTLFSHHDDIVYPQTTGALAGTRAIALGGIGHVQLLYDRSVRSHVFDTLAAVERS